MALETASYVANLVSTNPDGGDQRSTADDHIRLIKASLKRTFPLLDSAVSLSAAQVHFVGDLSASVQLQINQLRDGSATANNAINSRYANSASFASFANRAESASYAALAGQASSASYAILAGHATSASFALLAATATNALTADIAGAAATATTAMTAANATFAATCTSASSAAALAGYTPSTSPTPNTAALRDESGYLYATYMRCVQTTDDQSAGRVFIMTNGDGFMRPSTLANFGAYLEARNITGRTGIAKTLSTSAPSGGSNGDVWYRY